MRKCGLFTTLLNIMSKIGSIVSLVSFFNQSLKRNSNHFCLYQRSLHRQWTYFLRPSLSCKCDPCIPWRKFQIHLFWVCVNTGADNTSSKQTSTLRISFNAFIQLCMIRVFIIQNFLFQICVFILIFKKNNLFLICLLSFEFRKYPFTPHKVCIFHGNDIWQYVSVSPCIAHMQQLSSVYFTLCWNIVYILSRDSNLATSVSYR